MADQLTGAGLFSRRGQPPAPRRGKRVDDHHEEHSDQEEDEKQEPEHGE